MPSKANVVTTDSNKKQYIVVKIGSEQYGIDISYIDNIVRMQKITRVPKAQPYFNGCINLRGDVVPVMSIRKRMGLKADEFTNNSRIIILKMEEHGNLGVIVDMVREVVVLGPEDIDSYNPETRDEKSQFIKGIGKNNGQLISLLEVNSIIEEKENV
ncbi:MAG: chemotaxis protein CheW [Lachnospiraceae bacterium]|jgi:purine-binding chemotaxis protein CheW|nr:chemotaxis protein CheW [Lachnospiraceae bacterium]